MINYNSDDLFQLVALFSVYKGLFDEYPIQSATVGTEDDGTYSVISKVILALSIFIGILAFTGCYGMATDNKLYLLVVSI